MKEFKCRHGMGKTSSGLMRRQIPIRPHHRLWSWRLFPPILTAEQGLDDTQLASLSQTIERQVTFVRDLEDSDALHWGEGKINISDKNLA